MKFTFDGKVFVSTTTTVISGFRSNVANGNSTGNSKDSITGESKPQQLDDDGDGYLENCDSVLVTVSDTGIGLNRQIKDQLFEKFATKSRQGTGLGLYLSKKIIESHGGAI